MPEIIKKNEMIMKAIIESLEKGQKLKYVGKGFIGWNPEQPIMTFAMKDLVSSFDIWVDYNFSRMMVLITEVEICEN